MCQFISTSDKEIEKIGSHVTWRKQNIQLHINEVAFIGNSALPPEIKDLKTPFELFSYFFDDELVAMISEETNRSALYTNPETEFATSIQDIRQFIGILMYMSVYRYPNIESYWGRHAFGPIANTMPRNRFMAIKQYMSFQDEAERKKKGEPGYDPLFRIRNVSNHLNDRFDSVPKTSRLCIDEQMCSTKMKHHLRQYMPNKPHKWGVKLFVLCDSQGYAYKFEIYNGAGDNVVLENCPNLGATSNVVVRLSQSIPEKVNHILYFDNFYTSVPLLVYLRARGIYSLGTIRSNRIPSCKLPSDNDIKDEPRGYSTEFVANVKGVTVSNVLWKDSKSVKLASTYVGVQPFTRTNPSRQPSKATRFDRQSKIYREIDCPEIIREYNRHMGGVDLMDGLMGRYHIRAKSKNVMMRIFYHFIDMAATNAYVLYHRLNGEKCSNTFGSDDDEKLSTLPTFREEIAEGLVTYSERRPVGRPSSRTSQIPIHLSLNSNNKTVGKRAVHPVADVRYNNADHMSLWMGRDGKKRCKLCKNSDTQHTCRTCKVHLCNNAQKNCHAEYHEQK